MERTGIPIMNDRGGGYQQLLAQQLMGSPSSANNPMSMLAQVLGAYMMKKNPPIPTATPQSTMPLSPIQMQPNMGGPIAPVQYP